jgi:hypothetical protein
MANAAERGQAQREKFDAVGPGRESHRQEAYYRLPPMKYIYKDSRHLVLQKLVSNSKDGIRKPATKRISGQGGTPN